MVTSYFTVDFAMEQIPRSTERIASLCLKPDFGCKFGSHLSLKQTFGLTLVSNSVCNISPLSLHFYILNSFLCEC